MNTVISRRTLQRRNTSDRSWNRRHLALVLRNAHHDFARCIRYQHAGASLIAYYRDHANGFVHASFAYDVITEKQYHALHAWIHGWDGR